MYKDTKLTQLWTVSVGVSDGIQRGHIFNVTVMFLYLPNKKQTTYDRASKIIKILAPEFDPKTLNCDYEIGEMNSLKQLSASPNSGLLLAFS